MNTPETMQRERQAEQELLRQRAAQARTVQARPAPEIGEQQARRQARRPLAGMDEVIPLRSVQIAEELKQGAAKSLSKSERKSWQRQKEAELQAALGEEAARRRAQEERRAFLAPAFAMMDQMEQGIMDWREAHEGEKAEDGLAQSFAEDLAQRLQPAEALDLSALGAAGAPPEAAELSSMLTRLLDTRPADFTGEMAKEMNAQYKALPIPKAAVSDHLDDLAVAQPQANYFLLLHGAALSLQNHVERQAPEGVEQRQLSRLYAIAAASGLAAGAILSDPSYQKGRTEAAVAAEAKLETVRRREEWQQYIRTGQGTGETVRANWHLAPFSDPIWSLLEEEFPILREGGIPPLSIQDFSRRMERFNIALQENIAACNSFLRRQSAENPLLLKPDAAESLRAAMLQRLGRRALTEKFSSDPAAFAEAYQGVLETDASFREASDRYRERLNQLGASAAALRSFIRTDADVQRSLSDLDEEAFAEYAEQLRTQIEGNLEILDSAIAQNLPLIARAEARSAFIARFGATLLGGSPALVETAASSYTKRGLLSSLSHAAAQSARLLEQLLDEHMFVKSWQPLLDKKIARMTPEERRSETVLRDAIQELMSVVQRNEGSADELFRDRLIQVNAELLPAQWEALWETRRALLDTEDEDVFKSRLEEAIPPITAEKPAGAISYEAFLSGAPAAAAQKEQAAGAQAGGRYFAERLESGAFLNWEGFGGLLSGYADALPQALNGLLRQKDLTDIPGVDKIQSVADMDSQFSHMEFNRFLIGLRANVLRNLEAWNGCGLLREQLLPALLRGLPPEDFQGEAKKLQAELEDEARAQDLRFATTLLGESQEAGPVQYTYTASTKSSAWRGESSRPQRRLARFESAASLRQGLQEAGLLDAALAAYRQALKIYGDKRFTIQADCNTEKAAARQKHSDNLKALASAEIKADNNRIRDERKARATLLKEPFRKSLKSLLEGAEGRIEPGEYKRLNDLVNKLAGSADYTLEFGLGGFEDLVLNDGAGRQAAFTSQEREVYESALDEMPQRIDARVSALRGILDRFPESTFAQRREDIMANMRGMVVNLPDTLRTEREEDRVLADRNELRYGAKTWTEALMKLQMTLLTGTSEE
ncbi:MAG: hypothetical protein LBS10_03400, partial [Gracilibacteraceae bacterium]|nr:hypothetical protein [Gracilibacteraceae bacterium]